MSSNDVVLNSVDGLTRQVFEKLVEGSVCAVVVKGYLSSQVCDLAVEKMLRTYEVLPDRYSFAPTLQISKIGMTYSEVCLDKGKEHDYFATASSTARKIDSLFYPNENPAMKLLGDLDAIWPSGAEVAQKDNKLMNHSIVRQTELGGDIPLHQDDITQEDPDGLLKPSVEIVSNIFLSAPITGGGFYHV